MAGLLALLGLAVPLAIHLWNRRPGRMVQVGSVRWLAAAANRRLRNLRLEQVWLLLLRAAVVLLLALAVAQPLWVRSLPQQPVRGHVLLSPEVLRPEVLPALRPSVDSLRRRGFALRLFASGFQAISAQAWASPDSLAKLSAAPGATALAAGAPSVSGSATLPDDYWARAQQATDSFPNQPLRVVSGAARKYFTGPRPALPARLTWQAVPLPDSVVWLAEAAVAKPGTLRLLVGRSAEDATTFRVVQQALPRAATSLTVGGLPELHYQPAQAGHSATIEQPNRARVPVAANPLRVVLYADASHIESARYVRAALEAAALGLAQRLEITSGSSATAFAEATPPNWLFWLSDKPAPTGWRAQTQRGAQLWQEATGAGTKVETELDLTGLAIPSVAISRLDTTAKASATKLVVWQDGTGRPVLTHQSSGTGGLYQLTTRLQPTWSGLPDSPALPELFLELLRPAAPPDTYASSNDLRQVDTRQLSAPVSLVSGTHSATPQQPADLNAPLTEDRLLASTDLRPWAVLAALVLFAVERWLATRRTSVSS